MANRYSSRVVVEEVRLEDLTAQPAQLFFVSCILSPAPPSQIPMA